jgi:hypothetical protein
MISGNYSISLQLPDSIETGTLTLNESNGVVSGSIRSSSIKSSFQNGRSDGNKFEFSGILNKLLFKIRFTVRGEVKGDNLTAVAETKYGNFNIFGKRI